MSIQQNYTRDGPRGEQRSRPGNRRCMCKRRPIYSSALQEVDMIHVGGVPKASNPHLTAHAVGSFAATRPEHAELFPCLIYYLHTTMPQLISSDKRWGPGCSRCDEKCQSTGPLITNGTGRQYPRGDPVLGRVPGPLQVSLILRFALLLQLSLAAPDGDQALARTCRRNKGQE